MGSGSRNGINVGNVAIDLAQVASGKGISGGKQLVNNRAHTEQVGGAVYGAGLDLFGGKIMFVFEALSGRRRIDVLVAQPSAIKDFDRAIWLHLNSAEIQRIMQHLFALLAI